MVEKQNKKYYIIFIIISVFLLCALPLKCRRSQEYSYFNDIKQLYENRVKKNMNTKYLYNINKITALNLE